MSGTYDQQRDNERIPILGELRGEVTVFQPITIREISCGGAQIETTVPLQLNSLHQFRLVLAERSVVVKGRVAHCRVSDVDDQGTTYRSGVEFIDVSEPVATVIAEFVVAIKTARQTT
jgi:c-di-GMP-binding flagellar brake protein YcgR